MSSDDTGLGPPHRVVIIGGGFGGMRAAKALASAPVQVTLIDQTNHHLFQPLLYQVATGVLSAGQIAPALRALFRHQTNARILLGVVADVDLDRKVVRVVAERELDVPYDTLIVAAGATHSYFGHREWAEIAPGMKTLDDARRLRTRILGAFELADQESDPEERDAWLTFAIVGAGPTGVELAGQIAVLSRRVLRGDYRRIDTASARVILLDAVPTVLGQFPEKLQHRAMDALRDLGVELRLGNPVVGLDHGGVEVRHGEQSERIDARTVIWAAGVRASPLAKLLATRSGGEVDRSGRLLVREDLTLPGHPEVFAIGDMISLPGVPGTAQPAIQEGKYVARVVRARRSGRGAPGPFKYRDLGTMAAIGREQAVADIFGRIKLWGFPAFLIWGVVHLVYLVGWGNRLGAVARWMWTMLARNRRERLISIVSLVSEEAAHEQFEAMRAAREPRPHSGKESPDRQPEDPARQLTGAEQQGVESAP